MKYIIFEPLVNDQNQRKMSNFTGKLVVQNVCLLQSLLCTRQRNDVDILGLFPPLLCTVAGHRQYGAHRAR